MNSPLRLGLLVAASAMFVALPPASVVWSQEADEASPPRRLVDFVRDVQPILTERCLECHGPDEAKNDFRIDDAEYVSAYVEPEDLESSSMWVDYLITEDPDMLMPPGKTGVAGGLSGRELAVIKLWIEEGAEFDWQLPEASEQSPAPQQVEHESPDASLPARVWAFQGLFHPASVHFPVALLMVSGLFVLLSFFSRASFEPVAFHCLWIGALGAAAACVMGWAYAEHEGYGSGFSLNVAESAIDRHRWLGIAVAVVSLALIPLAHNVCRTGAVGKRFVWLCGALLVAGAVSITGYQGGELTYGEDHYVKEFERLFPSATSDAAEDVAELPAEVATVPETPDPPPAAASEEPAAEPAANDETTGQETSGDAAPASQPAADEAAPTEGGAAAEEAATDGTAAG